jgi:hypothetical protein
MVESLFHKQCKRCHTVPVKGTGSLFFLATSNRAPDREAPSPAASQLRTAAAIQGTRIATQINTPAGFASELEEAVVKTVDHGILTADLASLSESGASGVTTEAFLDAVAGAFSCPKASA